MKPRLILGLTEPVIVKSPRYSETVTARIDTGATSSSIDTKLAQKLQLEELKDTKVVKSASGVGKRSVVRAKVIIKGTELAGVFTLANRSHLTYQLLIGQNLLKAGCFLIDPLTEEPKKRKTHQRRDAAKPLQEGQF